MSTIYNRRQAPPDYSQKWTGDEFASLQRSLDKFYEEGSFTPTFSGLTTVVGSGTIAYEGSYIRTGKLVFVRIGIHCTGGATSASTANTTRLTNLPFEVVGQAAGAAADNFITSFGVGLFYSGTGAYLPTWSANSGSVFFSGTYSTT